MLIAAITVEGYKLGKVIIEGKTKQVYDLPEHPGLCLLLSKDRITAGDGVKAHDLAGKAEISNTTNGQVFRLLNEAGKFWMQFLLFPSTLSHSPLSHSHFLDLSHSVSSRYSHCLCEAMRRKGFHSPQMRDDTH